MTAQIVPFPPAAAPVAAGIPLGAHRPASTFAPFREYAFGQVVQLLGLHGHERRTQIAYLRQLVAESGLPVPKNPRRANGHLVRGAQAIGARSRWCAMEMDAWLDFQRTPPPAALGLDRLPPLPAHLHADMAARALQLAGAR